MLGVMGYTDHSVIHCSLVAERAAYILKNLGYSAKEAELVKIAGFMHDIGNAVNRYQVKNKYGEESDFLKPADRRKDMHHVRIF